MLNKFIIIVPLYNVEKWVSKNIKSIQLQDYENYECYLVDDMSTDNTVELASKLISGDSRFHLTVNKEKKYALRNICEAIESSQSSDNDVIVTLDGDDWLATKKALTRLNKTYNEHGCELTYGSYIEFPSMTKGKFCREIPTDVVKHRAYRQREWVSSHLRTFKSSLWKKIAPEDLKNAEGEYHAMAWDMAFMFPMLEMAGPLAMHIPEINYVYNRDNPINDDKVNHKLQLETEMKIRQGDSYENSFVTCEILGPSGGLSGLGNQLFCISTALAYGIETGRCAVFPQINPRNSLVYKFRDNFYKNLQIGRDIDIYHRTIREKKFSFDELNVGETHENVKLSGYFQSEKYFKRHRSAILKALGITQLQEQVRDQHGDYSGHVSIHVRRGDYLSLADFHHNLPLEYYKKAVKHFSTDEKFVVFSDDISWCRKNFSFLKNVEFSEGREDWIDLILMSSCKSNIIANSTFSWWAAWLNTTPEKLVVCPGKWFGPKYSDKDVSDLIPDEWVVKV